MQKNITDFFKTQTQAPTQIASKVTALAVPQTTALATASPMSIVNLIEQPVIVDDIVEVEGGIVEPQPVNYEEIIVQTTNAGLALLGESRNEVMSSFSLSKPETEIKPQESEHTQPLNSKDPHLVNMLKNPIAILKGLYVNVEQPTEQPLFVKFTGLNQEQWDKLSDYILLYQKEIDIKYAKRKGLRGRNFTGTGTLVKDKKTMSITHSPFPSSMLNVFKTIRTMRSNAYLTYCPTVLKRQKNEGYQSNFNILPYSEVLNFQNEIKEMDKRIDEVNQEIIAFKESEDFANHIKHLGEILSPAQVEYLTRKSWTAGHCQFKPTDIALDLATVKSHIEDEYLKSFQRVENAEKAATARIGEAERKALEEFENNYMQQKRDEAEQALNNIRKKLGPLVERILANIDKPDCAKPERIKADLERIRRQVVSIGLDQLESTVTQLMDVFDHPEQAYANFGAEKNQISEVIDERIDALIRSI